VPRVHKFNNTKNNSKQDYQKLVEKKSLKKKYLAGDAMLKQCFKITE